MLRLLLAGLVFQLKDHEYIPFIVGLAAILTIVNLYPRINSTRQWWSIKYQFFISLILLLSCVLVYFKKIRSDIIAFILYASVIGGVVLSFFVKSC